ncbi:MAG: hypothetical protein U9R15_03210 [Chloroflexota bacterium]|nr:hypothetical protein [Chloroflexota bacterium]
MKESSVSRKVRSGGLRTAFTRPALCANLHNMKYWFFISYTSPDILFFETELETGQVNSSQPSQPRIGEYIEKGNSPHWRNSLNLGENSGDFFQLTRDKQQEIILEFARESYNQAKIVNPLPNLTPHTPDRTLTESKRRDLP